MYYHHVCWLSQFNLPIQTTVCSKLQWVHSLMATSPWSWSSCLMMVLFQQIPWNSKVSSRFNMLNHVESSHFGAGLAAAPGHASAEIFGARSWDMTMKLERIWDDLGVYTGKSHEDGGFGLIIPDFLLGVDFMEKAMKVDDFLGLPLFQDTSICWCFFPHGKKHIRNISSISFGRNGTIEQIKISVTSRQGHHPRESPTRRTWTISRQCRCSKPGSHQLMV